MEAVPLPCPNSRRGWIWAYLHPQVLVARTRERDWPQEIHKIHNSLSPLWLCFVMLPEVCVMDGVKHFTCKGKRAIWQGLLDYFLQRGQVSHRGDTGFKKDPLHSKLLSQGSLCAAVSRQRHRLGQWFMSEGLYVPEQLFVSLS